MRQSQVVQGRLDLARKQKVRDLAEHMHEETKEALLLVASKSLDIMAELEGAPDRTPPMCEAPAKRDSSSKALLNCHHEGSGPCP